MNRVDVLNSSREDNPIVLTEFNNIYKKHKRENRVIDYLYCFYEGKDDSKYYNFRVENINSNNKKVSHLSCKGKDKVIKLCNILKSKEKVYKEGKLLFFIDKDFDALIKQDKLKELQKIEDLYITPTYSIENLYTSIGAFHEILKSEFHLMETEENFQKLTDLFRLRQNEFHQIMLDVNSWIATQNYFLETLDTEERRKIPYNELNIDKFLRINLEKITYKEENLLEFLENKFDESFKMEEIEVFDKFRELKDKLSQNSQVNFRGKFELEFLTKFLISLKERCTQKDGLGLCFIGINKKIKVQLTLNDTISNLSQYADTPECLKRFIIGNSWV